MGVDEEKQGRERGGVQRSTESKLGRRLDLYGKAQGTYRRPGEFSIVKEVQ